MGKAQQGFETAAQEGLTSYNEALQGVNRYGQPMPGIVPLRRVTKEDWDALPQEARDISTVVSRTPEGTVYELAVPRIAELLNTMPSVAGAGGLTLGAGPVLRGAPKAALPAADELGFYSALERTATKAPSSGRGEQLLSWMRNQPGVKDEEIRWMGLDDFVAENPKATLDEIRSYIENNKVELTEVTKESSEAIRNREATKARNHLRNMRNEILATGEDPADLLQELGLKSFDDLDNLNDLEAIDMAAEVGWEPETNIFGNTPEAQYGRWTESGGKNYREILLTMPDKSPRAKLQKELDVLDEEYDKLVDQYPTFGERPLGIQEKVRELRTKRSDLRLQMNEYPKVKEYRSSHFQEKNILAHARVKDREINGKKTFFIEEIQSDWHQQGREAGYANNRKAPLSPESFEIEVISSEQLKAEDPSAYGAMSRWRNEYEIPLDAPIQRYRVKGTQDDWGMVFDPSNHLTGKDLVEDVKRQIEDIEDGFEHPSGITTMAAHFYDRYKVPDAPFKKTWHELAFKRMLRQAIENGDDQIAWTTGAQQKARYGTGGSSNTGMEVFYDQILPKYAQKLGKKFGAKVSKGDISGKGKTAKQFAIHDDYYGINQEFDSTEEIKSYLENRFSNPDQKQPTKVDVDRFGGEWRARIIQSFGGAGQNVTDIKIKMPQQSGIWIMDITPEMRRAIMDEGQPLFTPPATPAAPRREKDYKPEDLA